MAKRVVFIAIGVVLLIGGAAVASAGGMLIATFGTDSTMHSGRHTVSTSTYALVSDTADLSDINDLATALGRPRVQLSVADRNTDVFIGVGPSSAVDQYLAGVAVDEVSNFDIDPFRLQTERREGIAQPAPPTSQPFWTATGNGSPATLDWRLDEGSYRLVVMNSDGSRDVRFTARFALEVPHLFPIGVGALIVGVLAIAGGLALLIASRPGRRPQTPTGPGPFDGELPPAAHMPVASSPDVPRE